MDVKSEALKRMAGGPPKVEIEISVGKPEEDDSCPECGMPEDYCECAEDPKPKGAKKPRKSVAEVLGDV